MRRPGALQVASRGLQILFGLLISRASASCPVPVFKRLQVPWSWGLEVQKGHRVSIPEVQANGRCWLLLVAMRCRRGQLWRLQTVVFVAQRSVLLPIFVAFLGRKKGRKEGSMIFLLCPSTSSRLKLSQAKPNQAKPSETSLKMPPLSFWAAPQAASAYRVSSVLSYPERGVMMTSVMSWRNVGSLSSSDASRTVLHQQVYVKPTPAKAGFSTENGADWYIRFSLKVLQDFGQTVKDIQHLLRAFWV